MCFRQSADIADQHRSAPTVTASGQHVSNIQKVAGHVTVTCDASHRQETGIYRCEAAAQACVIRASHCIVVSNRTLDRHKSTTRRSLAFKSGERDLCASASLDQSGSATLRRRAFLGARGFIWQRSLDINGVLACGRALSLSGPSASGTRSDAGGRNFTVSAVLTL